MNTAKIFILSGVIFALLDAVWIGYVATGWYKQWFGDLGRYTSQGNFDIRWIPATLVYVLLATALTFFVLPHFGQDSTMSLFINAALLGLLVYGTYDLTNAATLTRWPLALVLADSAWGMFAFGTTATLTRFIARSLGWL